MQPVLKNYCYRCHGAKKMKPGVRVDILDGSLDDKQLFLLKHVLEQLKDVAMPPEDDSPVPETTVTGFLSGACAGFLSCADRCGMGISRAAGLASAVEGDSGKGCAVANGFGFCLSRRLFNCAS